MLNIHKPITQYFWAITLPFLLIACSDGNDSSNAAQVGPYADEALWLCKPGIALDRCLELDQTITYVYEDGNMAVFEHEPVVDAPFD